MKRTIAISFSIFVGTLAGIAQPMTDIRIVSEDQHSVVLEFTPHIQAEHVSGKQGTIFTRFRFFESQITYDSEHLIPNIRVNAEASLLAEQAMNFYGFNGFNAPYNPDFEKSGSTAYISKVFYRHDRKILHFKLDFMGDIAGRKLRWILGATRYDVKIGSVNIDKLNKGASESLPNVALLYDKFVDWGIIPETEKNGGINNITKAGIVYDTRDNEPNPMKGLWVEAMIVSAPGFANNRGIAYSKAIFTHRQYFTLKKEVLNFAYRLSYQTKLSGNIPFYMLPVLYNTSTFREGLGGGKSLRGVLRNRIVGDGVFFANIELRWKFWRFHFLNQNFYGAMAGFTDMGRVTANYHFTTTSPEALNYLSQGASENWHKSYGIGFYGAMNQNFVISTNYGIAANASDGTSGIYIGLDFLF